MYVSLFSFSISQWVSLICNFQIAPALREECTQSPACAPYAKHFEHCTEKVSSGQGRPHEDCVEELCMSYAIILIYHHTNMISAYVL